MRPIENRPGDRPPALAATLAAPAGDAPARPAADALALSGGPAWPRPARTFAGTLKGALDGLQDFVLGLVLRRRTGAASLRVERNPDDVNGDHWFDRLVARGRLAGTEAAEEGALGRLDAASRARYGRVASALAHDPPARLALQALLRAGTLTAAKDAAENRPLLERLDRLAAAPLAPGVDRGALLADLVEELADPEAIDQQGRGTCVAAVGQILLAKLNPAEVARLVEGLASPAGRVALPGGGTLARAEGWDAPDRRGALTPGRTVPSRLLQPAFMEFANGDRRYDNRADRHDDGRAGLTDEEAARLYEGLTGRTYTAGFQAADAAGRERLFGLLATATGKGEPVPAGLAWARAGGELGAHKVLVTEVAGDRVYFADPFGQRASMAKADFLARLNGLNLPA